MQAKLSLWVSQTFVVMAKYLTKPGRCLGSRLCRHQSITVGKGWWTKQLNSPWPGSSHRGRERKGSRTTGLSPFSFTPSGPELIFGWHRSHLRQISPPWLIPSETPSQTPSSVLYQSSSVLFNQIKLTRLIIMDKGDDSADKGVGHQTRWPECDSWDCMVEVESRE